ncbi:MAG: hypothetical protein H0W94_01265 [Actinobacteria bacterium]|nr:hypothetical protein [Actinomycetota bacterium]
MICLLVSLVLVTLTGPATATEIEPYRYGWFGCSNTWMTVDGYHRVSDANLLWPRYPTGGKSIEKWADNDFHGWDLFEENVVTYGIPIVVWVQVCESEERPVTTVEIRAAIANVLTRVPSAVIYLSAINGYHPVDLCPTLGPDGNLDILQMVDEVVAEGYALRGPDLGPLKKKQLAGSCHPNLPARDWMGEQLAVFFDVV